MCAIYFALTHRLQTKSFPLKVLKTAYEFFDFTDVVLIAPVIFYKRLRLLFFRP